MWPSWARSSRRKSFCSSPSPSSPSSSPFYFSTFKDIQTLCKEDAPSQNKIAKIFHRVRLSTSSLRQWNYKDTHNPREGEKRIIVYFTSLRVVRKTYEDCRTVRSILRGFRVSLDERDVSMASCFLEELQEILGQKKMNLPIVFIDGRFVGGADEIKQMHETGKLKQIVQGYPKEDYDVCERCSGLRFVLCSDCNGSHKCYTEKSGFKSCSTCNENGLVRCPKCRK